MRLGYLVVGFSISMASTYGSCWENKLSLEEFRGLLTIESSMWEVMEPVV